jgi:hypothetical protein
LELGGIMIAILPSSTLLTTLFWFDFPPKNGRTRQYTLMFPTNMQKNCPFRTVYENFILNGTKKNTQILVIWKTDMCNRKFKTSELNLWFQLFYSIVFTTRFFYL